MARNRPCKNKYYLTIAEAVAQRSTCLRRMYGAVLVKDDRIIATGYNGSPRGEINCVDRGTCYKIEQNIPHNTEYTFCNAVHAEQNAIIQGTADEMLGSTLYIYGYDLQKECVIENIQPCPICRRMIVNAGIIRIIVPYVGKHGETWEIIYDATKATLNTNLKNIERHEKTGSLEN